MKKKETSITERITMVYEKLGFKSKRSFSMYLQIPYSTLNDALLNKVTSRKSVIREIVNGLPTVIGDWVITGGEEPDWGSIDLPFEAVSFLGSEGLKRMNRCKSTPIAPVVSDTHRIGCPYYNVDFAGGFGEFLDGPNATPESYISMQPYDSLNCFWCNLSGRSMEPAIMSGDKIVLRPMTISDVIYGKIYAVVTRSGMRTVKHIVRSDDPTKIRLVPENKDPMFGDYQDIEIVDVLYLFEVLASVRVFQ